MAAVGLGGYAGQAVNSLLKYSTCSESIVQLASVFEPDQATHAAQIDELRMRGVSVVDSYDALLRSDAEAVWLPLPIHLHRQFTEQALAAAKAVLVEKPAAGSIQDVDSMITARDRSRLPVAVGFQDIYCDSTAYLKRMILAGEIGSVKSITVTGCWPRSSAYYGRNQWAGRQRFAGSWVLDSPANNALAHFVNLAIFLAGDRLNLSGVPESIEAELYRVNSIENYDTCAFRLRLASGANILIYLTHASMRTVHPTIRIRGTEGHAEWRAFSQINIQTTERSTTLPIRDVATAPMISRFAAIVRGDIDSDEPFATLEQARAHTITVNGASEARAITSVGGAHVHTRSESGQAIHRYLPEIESLFDACSRQEELPHESGLAAWSQPAGQLSLRHYRHFPGPNAFPTPATRQSERDLATLRGV
jgi:predicted dehydrogenase